MKCPECSDDDIGEIGKRLYETVCHHDGKDKKHMLKHSYEQYHANVSTKYFQILENRYLKNLQTKICEIPFNKKTAPFTEHTKDLNSFDTFLLSH